MEEAERMRTIDALLCRAGDLAIDADEPLVAALISEAQDAVLRRYSELSASIVD